MDNQPNLSKPQNEVNGGLKILTEFSKPYAPSILCQLNGGCMGCCGHSFENEKSIKYAIHKNTLEFNNKIPKTKQEFEEFRDRELSQNLRNGVCRNLIQINNQEVQTNNKPSCQFLCPLHPTRHKSKEDLRLGHCDIHYLCKSAKIFKDWDKKTQEEFLNYIKTKQLSNIQYSLKMDDKSILEEFQHLQNNHSKD